MDACKLCPSGFFIIDDGFNVTEHDEVSDCKPIQKIKSIHPNNHTVSGNVFTIFVGDHFVKDTSDIITIQTNNKIWTNITLINETYMTAVSPAGVGKNYPITLTMNGFTLVTTTPLFSYKAPNITNVIFNFG